eukprot:3938680-Pleurochrysis_carterae.AAC.1
MLDVRLLASGATPGDLVATLNAIGYVLTEAESRDAHHRLLSDGGQAHALEVKPKPKRKHDKGKRTTPDDKKSHDARKLRPADGEA